MNPRIKIITNQVKGVCNRLDMIAADLEALDGENTGTVKQVLEEQALGQIADLQQLVLELTGIVAAPEITEVTADGQDGGSAFFAGELNDVKGKEEEKEDGCEGK